MKTPYEVIAEMHAEIARLKECLVEISVATEQENIRSMAMAALASK